MSGAPYEPASIRAYYDRHTAAFVTYGEGAEAGAIHRAVWGPGVVSRADAFHYVEDRIVDHVIRAWPDRPGLHIVDLGCGVGASLCHLAARLPIRGTGVTLSPVQAGLAERRIRTAGLADRVRCLEGDYTALPPGIATADVVFAIESFVHGPDPTRFFATCRRLLRPGGVLFVCDDVARPDPPPAAARAIDQFRRGWHVNTLVTPAELQALAAGAGLRHERTLELTPYLELGRPRDRLVALLVRTLGWLPGVAGRYDYLVGGHALQVCLRRGWVGYDLAIFRAPGDPG